MEYVIHRGQDGTTLEVSGDIDLATAGHLSEALELCMEWDSGITVDLSAVKFMDSSGVRALIETSQGLNGNAPLKLRSPQPALVRLFELTKLADLPGIEVVSEAGQGAPSQRSPRARASGDRDAIWERHGDISAGPELGSFPY
jgi:anti-anti-sigma factor